MIDISEDQLQLLKKIFKKCPMSNNCISTLTFFTAIRSHDDIKRIQTTIARDPEGHSRLPRETFKQVFDRMEREVNNKTIEWETIIEYFTKRGRPLSKDEIKKLQEEDERIKLEQEEIKRKEEEIERRRVQRMMEDIAEDDDVDDHFKLPTDNEKKKRRRRRNM